MPFRPVFTLKLIALRGGPEWFTEVTEAALSTSSGSSDVGIAGIGEMDRFVEHV